MPRIPRLALVVLGAITLLLIHQLLPSSSAPTASSSSYDSYTQPDTHTSPRRPAGQHHPFASSSSSSTTDSDGVEIDQRGYTAYHHGDAVHPIEKLVNRGKRLAKELEAKIREVQTLEDAVDDYERGWNMKPPRGFERWYRFTQSSPSPHPPPVPTLLSLTHTPFLSFLSHPASLLRQRVTDIRENDKGSIFTFTFVPDGQGDVGTACTTEQEWLPKDWHERGKGRVKVQGKGAWLWRCNNTLTLLLPILPLLPPEMFTMDPPLELAFSLDDGPRGMVHDNFRDRSEALGKAFKVWPISQLVKAENDMRWTYGWSWSCPAGTPLKEQTTDMVLNDLVHEELHLGNSAGEQIGEKSFIADFAMSADYCNNPSMMGLHNVLINEKHRAAVDMVPVIATCRTSWNSDIVGVPLDGVHEKVEYVPWEQKSVAKAFWRGSATGLFHSKDTLWRQSQRERLHFFAQNKSDAEYPLLIERDGRVEVERFGVRQLNERWLDAGLSGGPVQCSNTDGTCEEMEKEIDFLGRVRKEDGVKFKYVIDVDGNGWSSRFRRLMASNNVVLKSTLFPEWFNDLLIPWYHYVPLKLDYTDLYDIMAFFAGSPDGTTPGRDDLAQEIAEQGLIFTKERWRMEDMQSFMFLLMLEYWRVMSDDRHAASYDG